MGHSIKWDNKEKSVVLQTYTDKPSKDDLYLLAQKSAQMLGSVDHTVHIIIDERKRMLTLSSADMQYLERMCPSNQGLVVIVVQDMLMSYKEYVHQMANKIAPNAFADPWYATSIDEARELLQRGLSIPYP